MPITSTTKEEKRSFAASFGGAMASPPSMGFMFDGLMVSVFLKVGYSQ
eukprot:CAMPEP_0182567460 /NCGR_PEP_ID=MMETSP1324-20130603/8686_1 /TAXON_ID=236786 /ORGANISM="Florenciella sp., Strain RCC1587" /LENGTH=47 /DNA_ID= /DNA_START= /DNA_END= /DNA_ORIENTATION=